jgi:hypothetical protein
MDAIKAHFSQFGGVQDIYMPQPHKGFCFVTYSDNASALKALRHGRGKHTFWLNIRTFCGIRWVHYFPTVH